ncbi:disintegrin and metalloproteinase domain-containing protein 20-like [Molossus molossus]|uniref:disintegrin and metalloproteinase domain-containing protein 20-like n=1 Tax=Molossus molossus TaxID=27622 RepID=UPI001746B23A|nr:disintegrin and metalloproteinase domain-containing protein 20-like [Molossus molossus]
MAVGEGLVHVKITLLLLWQGIFLFLPGRYRIGNSKHNGPPEIVSPIRHASSIKSPGWLTYSLHFGGQRHIVHIKVNKLFLSKHLPVFTYTDQGAILMEQPFVQNDCYYHGYVEGDRESLVALSTCLGGFQGIIQTNDMVYEIEPKRLSTTFEHFVYKMDSEETQFPPLRCGLTGEEIARQLKLQENVNFTLKQSGYEGWWTHKRFLELAVVVDHNRYLHHESNASDVQHEVCLVVNSIDMFLSSLDVDVVLMGIEIWTRSNPFAVENITELLVKFSIWKTILFNHRIPHDVAHVFIKQEYTDALGLAFLGRVCHFRFNCGVDSFTNDDFYNFAYIVSHEIGHNLGMDHDEKTCTCGQKTCIMFPSKASATRFSNCSYADFMNTMTRQTCLYFSHDKWNTVQCTRCGNGVVEEGEECDCGTLDLCMKDPCCESDCTLRPGAACAFGLCCKDCQIVSTGTVCRQEINECDLPEWCNGKSYLCPEDVYVQNGFPCEGGGTCYEKRCNNREEQCRKIFGKEAKSANHSCYTKINTQGDRFGHCGFNYSTYVKCNISDSLCGRIQCENVIEIPLLSDHSTVHWTHFNGVTCWGTDYHFGMTIPDIGDVKDGTECGTDHVCIKRKCVSRSHLLNNCSPETCNTNGVCNNKQNCHCNKGWEPPNCQEKGFGGSIDSGPPPGRKEKGESYLGLLWLILVVVILLCLLIWVFMPNEGSDTSIPPSPEENVSTLPEEEEQDVSISSKEEQ